MEFNQEVHINLDGLFQKYSFEIVNETKNYLELKSPFLIVMLVYNSRERPNNIYFITSSSNSQTIEIDNEILKHFFKSNLRLHNSNIKKFVSALAIFFEKESKSILQGNIKEIIRLEKYAVIRDKNYTDKFK